MKKLTILLACWSISISLYARDIAMNFFDELKIGKGSRSPVLLPNVAINDNILEVSYPTPLDQTTMLIRNGEGDIVYTTLFNLNESYMVYLPDNVVDEMYSVELIYGDIHLIGYFD